MAIGLFAVSCRIFRLALMIVADVTTDWALHVTKQTFVRVISERQWIYPVVKHSRHKQSSQY